MRDASTEGERLESSLLGIGLAWGPVAIVAAAMSKGGAALDEAALALLLGGERGVPKRALDPRMSEILNQKCQSIYISKSQKLKI